MTKEAVKPVEQEAKKTELIQIRSPNYKVVQFTLVGTVPYVQHRFGSRPQEQMKATQEAGSQQKGKSRSKPPKDFAALYEDAKHVSTEGWCGIPCAALRDACISACRTVGYKMTHAKLALWAEADGFDRADGSPLFKITKGEPEMFIVPARNSDGSMDLRARPKWAPGWEAVVRIKFDADMLTSTDVANLLMRAGQQVGIGEGRNDSRESAGLGWGSFEIKSGMVAALARGARA